MALLIDYSDAEGNNLPAISVLCNMPHSLLRRSAAHVCSQLMPHLVKGAGATLDGNYLGSTRDILLKN